MHLNRYTLTIRKEVFYRIEGIEIGDDESISYEELPARYADLLINPGKYGKITDQSIEVFSYEKEKIKDLRTPCLIPVADDEVINACQIVEMSIDEETGDLLVILGDGSSVSFEPVQGGEFLNYFDSSLFENAPKILEMKTNYCPF